MTMSEAAKKSSADAENPAQLPQQKPREWPTPKYAFSIYAPSVVTVKKSDLKEYAKDDPKFRMSAWQAMASSMEGSSNTKAHTKFRVKMASLIVKMVNRLLRDGIVPRPAVQLRTGPGFIFVQILIAPSVLPVLMRKCEYLGIGNLCGQCYAIPLETAAMPEPGEGPPQELELPTGSTLVFGKDLVMKSEGDGAGVYGGGGGPTTSTKTNVTFDSVVKADDDDEDAESVDTVGDDDDKVDKVTATTRSETASIGSSDIPRSVGIPLLSEKRKAELKAAIVKAREEWLQTASRVRVEQVAEEISAAAAFTWDYIAFVFCASTIAAVGLATDSAVTVLASMLVSPIMGPVLAFTFGTTLRAKPLIKKGLRNELMSLLICIFVGLFWGLIGGLSDIHERQQWPSDEMASRGQLTGLVTGILVAIPSGVATALSTLGKNSSGMVGVAISLSLLPPAVNAGICWMYAILERNGVVQKTEGDDTNFSQIGSVSFGLTMINIVCIWLSGVFTFWLKEVTPYKGKNVFWSRDLVVFRQAPSTANVEIINEGITAAVELQEAAGEDVYEAEFDHPVTDKEIANARRQGLAANAVEDAFFMDTDFGLRNRVVAGGAAAAALPNETTLVNVKRQQSSNALWENVDRYGGNLDDAGAALFNDNLLAVGGDSFLENESVPSDVGVNHGDVADQILAQGLYNVK